MFRPKMFTPKQGTTACEYVNQLITREMEKEVSEPFPMDQLIRAGLACSADQVVSSKTRPGHVFFVSKEGYQLQQESDKVAKKQEDALLADCPI